MRLLLSVLFVSASALASPVVAHPGHTATPAHVHVDQFPVDFGAVVSVGLLGLAAILTLRTRTKRG